MRAMREAYGSSESVIVACGPTAASASPCIAAAAGDRIATHSRGSGTTEIAVCTIHTPNAANTGHDRRSGCGILAAPSAQRSNQAATSAKMPHSRSDHAHDRLLPRGTGATTTSTMNAQKMPLSMARPIPRRAPIRPSGDAKVPATPRPDGAGKARIPAHVRTGELEVAAGIHDRKGLVGIAPHHAVEGVGDAVANPGGEPRPLREAQVDGGELHFGLG